MRFNPTALMGNHPVVQIINAARNGGNPAMLMQQMIGSNPQLAQIAAGKSPDQLMQVAENMCRERGTSVDEMLRQIGITR